MKKLNLALIFFIPFFSVLYLFSLSHADDAMVWVEEGKKIKSWPSCVEKVRKIPGTTIYRVEFQQASECLDMLRQKEDVIFVELSQEVLIPDLFYPAIGGGSTVTVCKEILEDVSLLASLGRGKDITIAVIDTGISFPLYLDSIKINHKDTQGDGVDNDMNGYVDDYSGWDFGDMDSDPADLLGHGTQVASILFSVAPDVTLLPVKVNSGMDVSFSTGDAAEAIYYAVSMGVDVINMSFSAENFSFSIYSAIISAVNSGIVVISAAGNDGAEVHFPAYMDEVISVGSHDAEGNPSWFSSVGDALNILGPGEDVCAADVDGLPVTVSGTSFSTPVISGIAGVLLSMNPTLKPESIKKILFKGTEDILDSGWDMNSGYGNINSKALVSAATPSINIPNTILQGDQLSIDLTLPPTDTQTYVYFALISDNIIWWMDDSGFWHNADETAYEPFMTLALDDFVNKGLYGDNGIYEAIDTTPHAAGQYIWGVGIFDKSGNQIAPVTWNEMVLLGSGLQF